MSKAAELAALIGSQTALSNRNLIINGAMQVAQRGTSFTSTGFTLDRMKMLTANTDNVAFTTTQSSTAPDGFANSLKVDITTAESSLDADELFRLLYKIEGQDLQQLNYGSSAATSVTLSFYVRSNVTGVYAVEFRLNASGTSTITKQYTISSADTWERKELTLPANTATAISNNNSNGFEISFALAAGSNFTTGALGTSWATTATASRYAGHAANVMSSASNEWHITGVQLEVGEQATPFEHRSFGDELARCQRYFFMPSNEDQTMFALQGPIDNQLWWQFPFPTQMRSIPSFTVYGDDNKGEVGKAQDGSVLDYESVNITNYSTITKGFILHFADTLNANYHIKRAEFDAEL
jgi:hypothetical protein